MDFGERHRKPVSLEARKPQCSSHSCNHYEYACGDSAAYKTGFHTARATTHITSMAAALSVEPHRLPNPRSPAQWPIAPATTPVAIPSITPPLRPLYSCSHTSPTNTRLLASFLKRQIQQARHRDWQQIWKTCSSGSSNLTTARRQPLWGPTRKPTKLINTKQTTASTRHQLRLGHGYLKSYLT